MLLTYYLQKGHEGKCKESRPGDSALGVLQINKAAEKEMIEKKRKEAEDKSYVTMMDEHEMESNKEVAGKYESVEDMEDDFM